MTWHLKDESLEKKLIELCPEFISNLQVAVEKKCPSDDGVCVGFLRHDRGKPYGNDLWFWISELVKVKEYNPNNWNSYPSVTPPEGILMRVETACDFNTYRECAIFEDGIWKNERNGKADEELYGIVKRFRPWEN